jgi:hypothetical protein
MPGKNNYRHSSLIMYADLCGKSLKKKKKEQNKKSTIFEQMKKVFLFYPQIEKKKN